MLKTRWFNVEKEAQKTSDLAKGTKPKTEKAPMLGKSTRMIPFPSMKPSVHE